MLGAIEMRCVVVGHGRVVDGQHGQRGQSVVVQRVCLVDGGRRRHDAVERGNVRVHRSRLVLLIIERPATSVAAQTVNNKRHRINMTSLRFCSSGRMWKNYT